MQATILAAASLSLVAAAYNEPAVTEAPAVTDNTPVEYYYADYDNVVVSSNNQLYYSSALSADAVKRETGAANAGNWSPAKSLGANQAQLYNLKGATFCGKKDQWGKYTQLFVAESGNEEFPAAVYGWKVQEGATEAAVELVAGSKWTVYQQENANVTDVECGPNDGLFVADKGNNAVYWIAKDQLNSTIAEPEYNAVVPKECGAAVAEVRSLSYNAETEQLVWSNNAAASTADAQAVPDASAGVFQYSGVSASASPQPVQCEAAQCDAWSSACAQDVKQVEAPAANETAQYWAVAQAWGQQQVSQGEKEVYDVKTDKVVANVGAEATYAQPSDADRSVLLVSDQEKGAVYAVSQNGAAAKQILAVNNAYGVAYNAHGVWADEASATSVAVSVAGVALALVALLI